MNNRVTPDKYPGPPYLFTDEDRSIDFKRYISLYLSNWYWFVITLFISISIAYGINRWSEEVFTVSSSMLIRDDQFGGAASGLANIFPGSDAFRSQQNLRNEIGILKSYNLNYKAMLDLPDFYISYTAVGKRGIAETRMYNDSPFVVDYDSLERQEFGKIVGVRIISDTIFKLEINGKTTDQRFGTRYTDEDFDFIIRPRDSTEFKFNPDLSNKYYFYFSSPVTLANYYRSKLQVTPIEEEASLVTLTTSGFVPEQEVAYLNMLMEKYLEFGLEIKNTTAEKTIEFIEDQLSIISDSLNLTEGKLEDFRLLNNLIDISREGEIIQRRLEQADIERSKLVLQQNYYKYLKDYLISKSDEVDIVAPTVMGVTDQLLIKMVEELSLLQLQKKQMAMNLFESAEPLKIIQSNIQTTRNALRENVNSGLVNIENSIKNIDSELSDIDKEIRKLPKTERQMINIQRKFDINNTVYTFLLEKRAEAGIAKASNVSDNIIIDYAVGDNSYRIKPRERQNILLALIIGLLIPVIGITLIDYFNDKIIDKKDIEKETDAPVIGFIGHNSVKSEIPVSENPGSTLSESFRSVRTNLKYFLKDISNPVIAVSSTITAEGKTFVSTNLATIISTLGKKILLVGLDLRKPRTHKILGIDNSNGISRYLIGESSIDEIIIKTNIENLWYTPSGPVPPNPAELIESPAMKNFIDEARKRFDYIIIDTPPVAIVTDALLLSGLADFYIFVVRQRYSSKSTLGLIEEMHRNKDIKSIGVIMNDISLTGYYGYGLRYGYSAGYGYSYGYNYYGQYMYSRYGYDSAGKDYYNES